MKKKIIGIFLCMLMIVVSTTSVGTVISENKTSTYNDVNQSVLGDKQELRIRVATLLHDENLIDVDTILIKGNEHTYCEDDCTHPQEGNYYILLDPGDYTVKVTLGLRSKTDTITITNYNTGIDFTFLIPKEMTTALPVLGTLQESEQKNIVLNQNNKIKSMTDYPAILIGTINSKVVGESYTSFHTVNVICISKNWGNHIPYANNVLISVSNEYIGFLGEGFIIGIFYGMPPP